MIRNRMRVPLLLLSIFSSFISYAQDDAKTPAVSNDTLPIGKWPGRGGSSYNLLYQNRERKLTVAAVGEVYTNDLIKTASPSFGGMLTGRLAGVYVTQFTGEPGNDDPTILVRGQAPLVMVDGTPQSFVSLNPEQIESITVLKDALSTALLGMRASGGVILITTKKGNKQGQSSIQFTAQQGIQQPTRMPKALNAFQYASLYNEALANEGRPALYTPADLDAYKNQTDPYGHPDVDWQKQILKNQATYSHYDLSFSGAAKNARYFANLDYMLQDGLFKTEDFNVYNTNAGYKRYIFRSNIEIDLSKYVATSLNLFGRIQNTNQPGATNGTIYSNLISTPNNAYPVKNADGSLGGGMNYQDNVYGQIVLSGYRPVYERDFKADFSMKGNLDVITKGLWIKGLAAINAYQRETIDRSKSFAVFSRATDTTGGKPLYNQFGTNGSQANVDGANAQNRLAYMEVSMGWAKTMGNHTLSALAMYNNDYRMVNTNLGFSFTGLAARVSYDYKQKYIAEFTAGYNGAELYPQSKRYGFFPAAGLGWVLTEEDFLKDQLSWLNSLKLRGSYGKTGNANAGYYEYYQYYGTGTGYGFGSTVPSSTTTLQQGPLANPDITWEKADKLSVGIDGTMFNRHLGFSADYFNDKYYDLLMQRRDGSTMLGTGYPDENIGINRYSGFELQASWQGGSGALTYFISPNFTLLKSKVVYTAEPAYGYSWSGLTGRPVGQAFGYTAEGLFQSPADIAAHAYQGSGIQPGDIKYKDLNNDGVINANDRAAIGNTKPQVYYGLSTGLAYKGFDLTVLAQGVANRSVQLGGNTYWAFLSNGENQAYDNALGRWTPANAGNATYPRLWIGNNTNNQQSSSYWTHKGDYLRIKNIELGYSLPVSLTRKARLTTVRLFVNATNLVTFTGLDNMDPENYNGLYPIMKVLTGGLAITF